MNRISIIIPIYNTVEFLNDSVKSALNQLYQDIELIMVNDGSDEDCTRFINTIAESNHRIKVFQFSERKGVGAARNFGIEKATGDFIYFLDSDDYIPQNTLQLLIDNINDYEMISGEQKETNIVDVSSGMGNTERETNVFIYTDNKFDLIKNKSVLNRLFRKDFILNNKLCFTEEIERYTDLSFIVPALLNVVGTAYIKDCLYYKRERNDPVNNPSIMQMDLKSNINDFLYIYNDLKINYTDNDLHVFLDNQLVNFYRSSIVKYFSKNKNVDCIFNKLVESTNRLNKNKLRKMSPILKMEIKSLRKGDVKKFKKLNLKHHKLRKVKQAVTGRTKLYIQMYRAVFLRLPMKENLVVFESFLGKSYSDSPKYIYEYMTKTRMKYKYVWVFNEKKRIPGNAIQVKRFSLRYYYYLARAKYWISNSRLPKSLNKREGNIYLQTWHGTPLKTLVFDIKDIYSADPKYKENFYQQSRRWDYLSSPNSYSSKIFRRAFKYEKQMLEFGYPRNDILYQKNTERDINRLKRKMKIPIKKKVILYAPTWRDDEFVSRGKYSFTLKLELDKLKRDLGKECIILLRTHYFIADNIDVSGYKGFVYDFSRYDDIAELYLVSDILITDYSSVFFDYANLKRPILFYTYDLEKYRDQLRGFYIDIEREVPGPLLMTTEKVIDAIENIEDVYKDYQVRYEQFYERFCSLDDGNASEKTVEKVFEK